MSTPLVQKTSGVGKKVTLSIAFILASAMYALFISLTSASPTTTALAPIQTPTEPTPAATPSHSTPPPTATKTPAPAPKPKGQYVDGVYTGPATDAYYGTVQVQATVSGGRLTNVQFLQYPNDRSTSRYLSGIATPQLASEAIQAQSANVNVVSGATQTSDAFMQSLDSALTQAKG